MNLLNKKPDMNEYEMSVLKAIREAYHATNGGKKACIVVNRALSWEQVLGSYFKSMINRVNDGLIYLRVLNSDVDQVTVEDLSEDIMIVDMGNIL